MTDAPATNDTRNTIALVAHGNKKKEGRYVVRRPDYESYLNRLVT